MVVGLRVSQQRSPVADLLVHTLDISSSGAKIGALREWMQPGSALIVQRRHTRARCLVMWSRKVAPGEIQIGIKFLGRDSHFWGCVLRKGSEKKRARNSILPGDQLGQHGRAVRFENGDRVFCGRRLVRGSHSLPPVEARTSTTKRFKAGGNLKILALRMARP